MNAMFRKEFRDLLRWIPVGMVLMGVLLLMAAPKTVYYPGSQSVEQTLMMFASVGCVIICLAFGLLQSIPDTRTDAKGYLLHRPVAMSSIFWGKLLAGFVAYLICLLPSYLAMIWYLDWKGPEQLPTCGAQMWPLIIFSLVLFAVHPATMWSTFRPVSWWSKWLPIAITLVGVFFAWGCIGLTTSGRWGFPIAALITLGMAVAAAYHAFCYEQFLPSPRDMVPSFPGAAGFVFGGMILVASIGVVVYGVLQNGLFGSQIQFPYETREIAFTEEGELWEVVETIKSATWSQEDTSYRGRIVSGEDASKEFTELPATFRQRPRASFLNYEGYTERQPWQFTYSYLANPNATAVYAFEHNGRIYGYAATGGLRWVVTPRGVYAPDEVAEGRFDAPGIVLTCTIGVGRYLGGSVYLSGKVLLADVNGLYQVDFEKNRIRQILDEPVGQIAVALPVSTEEQNEATEPTEKNSGQFWTLLGDTLKRHEFVSADPEKPLMAATAPEQPQRATQYYELPPIQVTSSSSQTIEPLDTKWAGTDWLYVFETSSGVASLVRSKNGGQTAWEMTYEIFDADGSSQEQGTFDWQIGNAPAEQPISIALLPPISPVLSAIVLPALRAVTPPLLAFLFAIHAVIAVLLTCWLAWRRGEHMKAHGVIWAVLAAPLGLAVPLTHWLLYPTIQREKCPQCGSLRRVDTSRCESCKAEWPRPKLDGNEILGVAQKRSSMVMA